MKTLILSILFFVLTSWVNAQDVIDLGTEGNTCSLVLEQIPVRNSQISKHFNEPSFSSDLEKWNNGSYSKQRPSKLKPFIGKSIFIFGTNDIASEAAAVKVKADFGLCVKYNNIKEVGTFRERTKISFPIQLATSYIIQEFDLKSYPVLIKIKEDSVEYSTDF